MASAPLTAEQIARADAYSRALAGTHHDEAEQAKLLLALLDDPRSLIPGLSDDVADVMHVLCASDAGKSALNALLAISNGEYGDPDADAFWREADARYELARDGGVA